MALPAVMASKGIAEQRRKISDLEDALMALPEEELLDVEGQTSHHFAPGIYARMIYVPKGQVIVGKIHRHETMNILLQGKIMVATEQGRQYFTAPCIVNSDAGIKKAAYAVEDTWWVNVHPTELTVLAEIEKEFIIDDYDQLEHKPEE